MDERRLFRLLRRFFRREAEPSLRESIAELVQEAEAAPPADTPPPAAALDREERLLITNVLRLRDTTAADVMIPRADIAALALDMGLEEVLEVIGREGHSRFPVYRDQLDDIVGMVHIKDIYRTMREGSAFSLEKILRRPLLVAPQIPVLDLLLQMRQSRTHLALVVDEYGGIDGLLTIEDLIETIVGDIADEHDTEAPPQITARPDGTLALDARLPLEDLEAAIGPFLTEEERAQDIKTVGGLVFTLAERVPARGEVILHPSGLEFLVTDADARRIKSLRVRRPDAALSLAPPSAAPPAEPAPEAPPPSPALPPLPSEALPAPSLEERHP
jgi:magnesium and cobalt transporter